MRVLLAPHGTRGDVQPMLAFADALRGRGHSAMFVVPANFVDWVRGRGYAALSDGIDIEEVLSGSRADLSSLKWQVQHLREQLAPRLFDAVTAASDGVDVIVGAGVQIAAASVAEYRGVPYASVVFCPCAVPGSAAPPPTVRRQTLPPAVNRVLWAIGGRVADAALRGPINRGRRTMGLPAIDGPLSQMGEHLILLAADRDLAPVSEDAPRSLVATDAWVDREPSRLDAGLDAFLDLDPAPIYFGFGSMVARDVPSLAANAIAAARAVGRPSIVAGGWAGLDRIVPAADDVFAARAVPHDLVLPRVAVAVHHGGAGTTTAAARAGVPQVVLPHILDQFYWAHRVESLHLGPRALPVDLVNADVLTDRLVTALDDPRIDHATAELGRAIAARDGTDAAVDALERLAEDA